MSTNVVHQQVISSFLRDDIAICVFIEDSDQVLDVIPLATVIEKLLDVTVIKLFPVELLPTLLVNDMAVSTLDKPSKPVDSSALLINVEALFGLKQLWNRPAAFMIVLEIDVAHEIVGVEVEFLDTERCRDLSLFIYIICVKELLLRVVLKNVSCEWVSQVASDICQLASLVNVISLTIFEDNNVATIVSVEFSQNVINIERPIVRIRWHLNWVIRLVKVFESILVHGSF